MGKDMTMKCLQLRFMLTVLKALDVLIHGASSEDKVKAEDRMYNLSEDIRHELAKSGG